jgi:hypothetical protein
MKTEREGGERDERGETEREERETCQNKFSREFEGVDHISSDSHSKI